MSIDPDPVTLALQYVPLGSTLRYFMGRYLIAGVLDSDFSPKCVAAKGSSAGEGMNDSPQFSKIQV